MFLVYGEPLRVIAKKALGTFTAPGNVKRRMRSA
jgi:hypothetical protein